ncbi:globin [Bacterioplanoides sp. SCSIO 12839]|uniref:globin n=1 Tax=Bacterioplanoides sp. SCSIO 12839 TaxID=2829569 RepID=UPI0021043153|nr:globin [Bacterioplanoides sp. SCSIO 12839]UTW47736.1 globin [Bacterioplanoides sp. SCSIO 12839]
MGDADLVFQSYGRACNNPSFFEEFYSNFMSKSPDIRAMFVNTNMEAQRGLLRGGVLWLIMHARGMSDAKIRALGESHSKKNMNINPMFYGFWLDALLETLKVYDPEFTPELELCWRSTLRPSIEMIQDMYDK